MEETNELLDSVIDLAEELQNATGVRVLWGTAQLFKHPRYMHGGAPLALGVSSSRGGVVWMSRFMCCS